MNVLFNVMSGRGHTQAGLRLANALRTKGHHVTFLCWPDAVEEFRAQDFSTVLYAEKIFSGSLCHRASTNDLVAPIRSGSGNASKPKAGDLFEAYLHHIVNGEFDARIKTSQPDVFVFDRFLWANALRVLFLGIPVVGLSIPMAFRLNTKVPPVTSGRTVRGNPLDRFSVLLEWMWVETKSVWINRSRSQFAGTYRHPYRFHHLTYIYREIAKQSGIEARRNRDFVLTEFGPRLVVPEIVCAPHELQFEVKAKDSRVFFGDYVDMKRSEPVGRVDGLDPKKPWVYCSLGTESKNYPYSKRFFRAVVETSRLKSDWQWILSVPNGELESDLEIPRNLAVSNWWPQIHVLGRAAVMVTHGGINSILEGIECEVPMVIVPGNRDQPGNAARAEACGISRRLPMKNIRPTELINAVQHCVDSSSIKDALTRIRNSIRNGNTLGEAINLIESVAAESKRCRITIRPGKQNHTSMK